MTDKLSSISSNEIVYEISHLINREYHVSSNWYGQRIVSINGYEGHVEIDILAKKYLEASLFQQNQVSSVSLQERLDCYGLWEKIEKLYINSDNELKKNRLLNCITRIKEFKFYSRVGTGSPVDVIREWEVGNKKDLIFEFCAQEFKEMWPEADPICKSRTKIGNKFCERWTANQESDSIQ